jgi:hypothetical protein
VAAAPPFAPIFTHSAGAGGNRAAREAVFARPVPYAAHVAPVPTDIRALRVDAVAVEAPHEPRSGASPHHLIYPLGVAVAARFVRQHRPKREAKVFSCFSVFHSIWGTTKGERCAHGLSFSSFQLILQRSQSL